MKILFIEDDYEVGKMYATQLELEQHEVVTVRTAQEALDALEADRDYDAVILDILLPGSNGLAVLQEMQSYEDWRRIPVVVLSNVNPDDLTVRTQHLHDLGVRDYLVKMDTSPQDLATAVKTAVGA